MNYLVLFSNCEIVDGYSNSIFIDLERVNYSIIPKTLSIVLKSLEVKSIQDIRNEIDKDSLKYFDSYIDFVIKNEFGFLTKTPYRFKKAQRKRLIPDEFNLVCEDSKFILQYDININVNIKALYLRVNGVIDLTNLSELLKKISSISSIAFVIICADYKQNHTERELRELVALYPILGKLYLYSSPKKETKLLKELTIEYIDTKYQGFKSCGSITPEYFSCTYKMFSESLEFNSCLQAKIAIDHNGNIKNCPSLPQSYGNIKDTTLKEALHHKNFKKYWRLTKDNIEVCKDCEFRYICTDCRAYTERTHINTDGLDISKPLKCGYNPYTGEWKEWSTNPLKQKLIKYYELECLINK